MNDSTEKIKEQDNNDVLLNLFGKFIQESEINSDVINDLKKLNKKMSKSKHASNISTPSIDVPNINTNKTKGFENIEHKKKVKKSKKTKKSKLNPLIENEIIWYSDELDSNELEKKFADFYKDKPAKNKKKINLIENANLDENANAEIQNDLLYEKKEEEEEYVEANINNRYKMHMDYDIKDNKKNDKNDDKNDDINFSNMKKELKEILSIEYIHNYYTNNNYENYHNENYIYVGNRDKKNIVMVYTNYTGDIKQIEISKNKYNELIDIIISHNYVVYSNRAINELTSSWESKLINKFLNHNDGEIKKITEKINISTSTQIIETELYSNPSIMMSKIVHRRIVNLKYFVGKCKKINSNIFEWNQKCNLNAFSYKQTGTFGSAYLNQILFIKNGTNYIPEKVSFYIDDLYYSTHYGEIYDKNVIFDGIHGYRENHSYFVNNDINKLTHNPFPLSSCSSIKIIIEDSNEIADVFFENMYESNDFLYDNMHQKNSIGLFGNTYEILYEGTESNIRISDLYGFYDKIVFYCKEWKNKIESFSMTNNDLTIFDNFPPGMLKCNSDTFEISFSSNNYINGYKVDMDNFIEFNIMKIIPDAEIKIYGRKLVMITNKYTV